METNRLNMLREAYQLVMQNANNLLIIPSNKTREQTLKERLQTVFFDDGQDIVLRSKSLGLQTLALTGAKGSLMHMRSMLAYIGFLNVDGKPMRSLFNNRLNMFYKKNDLDPTSHGVVLNSYLSGLTPKELLANSIPERIQ